MANLPPEYGLYSAFMGCFMYCVFGSVKDITIGPTAIMAIMTGDVFKDGDKAIYGNYYAVLLAFTTGILVLLFGLFQLGFLIDFISVPVIAGFTSAAAITIASGQIKGLLGVYQKHHWNETHAGVVDDYGEIFANIETVRLNDAVLGVSCAAVLLAMRVRAVGVISMSDSNSFDLVYWASKDVQISRGRVERKIHPEQSGLVRLHGAECHRGHHLSRHVAHSGE